MAKGSRSNSKKQLRTWRREKLVAKWQQDADAKRYAALEEALQSAPLPPSIHKPSERSLEDEEDMQSEEGQEQQERGRKGKKAKEPRSRDILPVPVNKEDDDEDMMEEDGPKGGKGKKGKKGINVRGKIQKKRKVGGLTKIGLNFHNTAKKRNRGANKG